jgi:hypothetical protein
VIPFREALLDKGNRNKQVDHFICCSSEARVVLPRWATVLDRAGPRSASSLKKDMLEPLARGWGSMLFSLLPYLRKGGGDST